MESVQKKISKLIINTELSDEELNNAINELCEKYGTEVVAETWARHTVVRPQG